MLDWLRDGGMNHPVEVLGSRWSATQCGLITLVVVTSVSSWSECVATSRRGAHVMLSY